MKKIILASFITVFSLTVAVVGHVHAEDNGGQNVSGQGQIDAGANTGDVQFNSQIQGGGEVIQGRPPMPPRGMSNLPPGQQNSIRQRMMQDYGNLQKNARNNADYRNQMMGLGTSTRRGQGPRPWMGSTTPPCWKSATSTTNGTSTRPCRPEIRPGDERKSEQGDNGDADNDGIPDGPMGDRMRVMMGSTTASSTMHFPERGEDRPLVRFGQFRDRKENISKQFHQALTNLTNVRIRVDSRIKKETSAGKNMASSTALLAIADIKIKAATDALAALDAYLPAGDTNASTTIDVSTARNLAMNVQKALIEAKTALDMTVRSIAFSMGVHLDEQN